MLHEIAGGCAAVKLAKLLAATGIVAAGFLLAEIGDGSYGFAAGTGVVLGAIITAFGTSIVQPLLKERGTQSRLERLHLEFQEFRSRAQSTLDEYKSRYESEIGELRQELAAYEERERQFLDRISRLVEQTARIHERNVRLSTHLLAQARKIVPGSGPVPSGSGVLEGQETFAKRILLIEDEQHISDQLATLIEAGDRNCRVEVTGSLDEALDLLDKSPPDVIVYDTRSVPGDGTELVLAVRQRKLKTRVIVTTARPARELQALRDATPDAILFKPFDFLREFLPVLKAGESEGGNREKA